MDLRAEKLELMQMLLNTHEESILKRLREVFNSSNNDNIDIEEYNAELDAANKRIDEGDFFTHEEALKRIQSWRTK